jgi:hypothetical protein
VSFTTSGGTAVAGVDYDAASGVVTIPRGQTSKTINLTWACDGAWQPKANKTVIVTLSGPSPSVPLGTPAATLTIQEDTAVRSLCLATRDARLPLASMAETASAEPHRGPPYTTPRPP